MIPERFGDAEQEIFQRLCAGAAFDVINAVLKECPNWDKGAQRIMVMMVAENLAIRWGVVDASDDEEDEEE